MSGHDCEGPLYLELFKVWDEYFCSIVGKKFQAFKKIRSNVPAWKSNKGELALEFDILVNECECKLFKYGLAELSKIMKAGKFEQAPFFFTITVVDTTYKFGAATEQDRSKWIVSVKNLARHKERKSDGWISTGFLEGNYPVETSNRFTNKEKHNSTNQMLPSQRVGSKIDKPGEGSPLAKRSSMVRKMSEAKQKDTQSLANGEDGEEPVDVAAVELAAETKEDSEHTQRALNKLLDEDAEEHEQSWWCCVNNNKVLGMKMDTFVRLIQVITAFPFVIVVSALNLSNHYSFLRSVSAIRAMNLLIYVAPSIYVKYLLSQFYYVSVQRLAIGLYILFYLAPVGYVVFTKVVVSSSTSKIEEGTFCFKPARTVRVTQANFYALFGFVMEWLQHVLYVLPLGIVTSSQATKLSDFPPYLSFEVYFWISVVSTFLCGLIIVLNAVLRGKLHYRFQSNYVVWFFLYNIGSPMFVTIVTILFMSLWCDFGSNPPTLVQQPSIVCYSEKHINMARAGLTAVAIYIIQHTLLPSGTFKETMRDNDLEIMFVPVYLQAHFLLKAIFSGVYVFFYQDNVPRVIVLTLINLILLALNNFMKPCSVGWVNLLRDTFFVHALLSGIISVNYLAWPINRSTKGMVISILASTIIFSSVCMVVYYRYTTKSTEYAIATAFLDLEWQVSRGGSVHARVLEPLISLTLSTEKEDWDIAKKYIGQLVWLISYPNMRVQFQSAWGLANLALLDDDARQKIHEAGGTKTLFEWYMDMDFVVQLESLAAMANLTLSMEVANEMVVRYKCVPFFIDLVASNKLKHAQFSAIALSNLARKESFRELIRRYGGIPTLVGCIMSHDYQKRRHGCRALANMALSPSKEIEQVFESKGLIDRIIKMALRKEIETQREVIALIRNLACHARLRPLLLDRGVMNAIIESKVSVFDDVRHWCEEITVLLERELQGGNIDLKALIRKEGAKGIAVGEADVDLLRKMEPLKGQVEWSTWGSKLESIFEPVFSSVPSLVGSQVTCAINAPLEIMLPVGITKQTLQKWRDSLSYVVIERPSHGKLSELTTQHDTVTYTPNADYVGTDFFSYRMQLGNISTSAATVAITIVGEDGAEADGEEDLEKGKKRMSGKRPRSFRRAKSGSIDEPPASPSSNQKMESFEIDSNTTEETRNRKPTRTSQPGKETNRLSGSHTPFLQGLMKKMSVANAKKEDVEESGSNLED